jgi:putative ABC transport system permease protein
MNINETVAKSLGIAGSAVGKKVVMFDYPMEIIGVVRDFYYDSPARVIEPIALTCYRDIPRYIYVRFDPSLHKSLVAQLVLPVFRQYDPEFVLNPKWCDDLYSNKFERERSLSEIVTSSTVLSLIIALLGLFAIHSYSASRRTKEIGIRKALGSSSQSIINLLSAEVVKLILIAGALAVPVSLFISGKWLENYANHTSIGWLPIILPIALQIIFTFLATLSVSIRVSVKNPVDSLRYE